MAEANTVVLQRILSVFQDTSYKYAFPDIFPVSDFRSEEANTKFISWWAILK